MLTQALFGCFTLPYLPLLPKKRLFYLFYSPRKWSSMYPFYWFIHLRFTNPSWYAFIFINNYSLGLQNSQPTHWCHVFHVIIFVITAFWADVESALVNLDTISSIGTKVKCLTHTIYYVLKGIYVCFYFAKWSCSAISVCFLYTQQTQTMPCFLNNNHNNNEPCVSTVVYLYTHIIQELKCKLNVVSVTMHGAYNGFLIKVSGVEMKEKSCHTMMIHGMRETWRHTEKQREREQRQSVCFII